MNEEKMNNAKLELDDQELENVAGGYRVQPSIPIGSPNLKVMYCTKCRSQNVRGVAGQKYHCNDCGADFDPSTPCPQFL